MRRDVGLDKQSTGLWVDSTGKQSSCCFKSELLRSPFRVNCISELVRIKRIPYYILGVNSYVLLCYGVVVDDTEVALFDGLAFLNLDPILNSS